MITRVKGTEDILDLRLFNYLIDQATQHLSLYNFSQIATPILEQTKLFSHTLGTATDVVTKEMYVFETKGGDSICLRPEATASTVRAYLENKIDKAPWNVFSYGPMFRHERPQKGRWRQFSQINIESINTSSVAGDAQFIKMIDTLFSEKLGLENYVLKTNFLGNADDRAAHRKKLKAFLEQHADTICATCTTRKDTNTLRVFDCKNETCNTLYQTAPKLTDELCQESLDEWNELNTSLDMLSVSRIHDPFLVRGLDYYNKVVFELSSDALGAQNAFCGGGRYSLGKAMGAKNDVDCIGAAIGIGRVMLMLNELSTLNLREQPRLHAIIPMGQAQKDGALLLAEELRAQGLCTQTLLKGSAIGKMMKKANNMGAAFTLVIGDQEQQDGTVAIKNMVSGEQETVPQAQAAEWLKR